MSSIVKKLKVMPISQILLDDYRGEISLKDKDVSNMLTERMFNKYKISDNTFQKIIERDREIFNKRGDKDSSYAFQSDLGLYDTLDILYDYIQPTDTERWFFVTKRFSDLTFSEVAVASRIFLNLDAIHGVNRQKLDRSYGSFQAISQEKSLEDFYDYLSNSSRAYLRMCAEYPSSIVKPSIGDLWKTSKIAVIEPSRQFSKHNPLYYELDSIRDNLDSYHTEIELIKQHPNMEQIYQKRR